VIRHEAHGKSVQSARHPRVRPCQRRRMPQPTPQHSADGPKTGAGVAFSAHRRGSAVRWDLEIARVAERQHGLISLGQLRRLGIGDATIRKRAAVGTLHRIHQGVYAVGHPQRTIHHRLMAAVLACGPGAVLSHRTAAALLGLRNSTHADVDVTAPNRRGRVPAGIAAHRDCSLTDADRTTRHGIPCTTAARTLLDFAAVAPMWELRKAVSEAEVQHVLDHRAVRRLIKAHRGRRGVACLRKVMDEIHPQTKRTRSEMEILFLRMCERAGLPHPKVNITIYAGGRRTKPDFLWPEAGLIVEADSRRYHDTDSAFQSDREREQRLQVEGWRVSRCTWEQIEREPRRLARTIASLLAQPSSRPTGRKREPELRFRPVGG